MSFQNVKTAQLKSTNAINIGVDFCLASAAYIAVLHAMHSLSLLITRMLWSNEGRAIFGSSMFYPTFATTVLFLVARLAPPRVVSRCTGFCRRKAVSAWKSIKKILSKAHKQAAKLQARAQLLASVRIAIGAWEMFCL
jgi:hypothetical protein